MAPSTVGTSASNFAVSYAFQRKSFYANGRFWVFWADGTNMVYSTSTDGVNWTAKATIRTCGHGNRFSVWFDGTYFHYAFADHSANTPMYYRRGTPNSDGSVTWSADEQTVLSATASVYYGQSIIAVDSAGYPWVGYSYWNGNYHYAQVVKASTNDGTWATAPGFPVTLSGSSDYIWTSMPVPLTNQKVLMLFSRDGVYVYAKLWNGSSFGSTETATGSLVVGGYFSAVADGDDVHLTFLVSAVSRSVRYVKRTYSSSSWSSSETILQSDMGDKYCSPVLAFVSSSNLYCFWAGYPTAQHIFYKKMVAGTWDSDPTDWITETSLAPDGVSYDRLTGFYSIYNSDIGLVYLTETASPYNVRFDFLTTAAPPAKPKGTIAIHAKLAGII